MEEIFGETNPVSEGVVMEKFHTLQKLDNSINIESANLLEHFQ